MEITGMLKYEGEDSLITSIEFNIPRVKLSVTNNMEHNLCIHLALKSNEKIPSVSEEIPLFPGS